jgi:hypothetical protein
MPLSFTLLTLPPCGFCYLPDVHLYRWHSAFAFRSPRKADIATTAPIADYHQKESLR